MNIVWLASYPKSGNTWVRFMLYAAIFGPPKNSLDVSKKIPDIHRPMPFDIPASGTIQIKTHFELNENHPKLTDTSKAIHIIRNPRDVMLSAINYRTLTNDSSSELQKDLVIKSFLNEKGDPHWKTSGFGTWASHARSWRNATGFPVLPIRYEDLKANPHAQLESMLQFLDIQRTQEQINEAVVASSFDFMRALEIREKKTSKQKTNLLFDGTSQATRKGIYFMNKGQSNQSLDTLMSGLDALFDAKFKDELAEFGYTPDRSP